MFRTSWSQALFLGERLDDSLARLSRLGYDAVELLPDAGPPAHLRQRLAAHGLACSSVTGRFIGPGRDLSSPDPATRRAAVDYLRANLDFAAELSAPVVILVPTRIGKLHPDSSMADEWSRAAESLHAIGESAAPLGITAAVECVNRAESYLANRLETARLLIAAAAAPNLGILADSFHMNIEETDLESALWDAAPLLAHVHLADNNRSAPGMGHMDLAAFVHTLDEIGYRGSITMECDVQAPDPYGRNAFVTDPAVFDLYAETALTTLRRIEARLAAPQHRTSP